MEQSEIEYIMQQYMSQAREAAQRGHAYSMEKCLEHAVSYACKVEPAIDISKEKPKLR